MSAMRLPGLSPYNMAAHLALLGAMRILEEDCPDWQARGHWEQRDTGWTPVLSLADEKTENDLCGVLAKGLCERAGIYQKALEELEKISGKKLTEASPKAFADTVRSLYETSPLDAEFLCALSAGLNVKDAKQDKIAFSPLFLLESANRTAEIITGNKGLYQWKTIEENADKIRKAFFQNDWMRVDNVLKFYWDYEEWGDQARMGRNPKKEKNRVEWATSALAQVGFSGLGAFPVIAGRLKTESPCWLMDESKFSFPLWTKPAIYDDIRELLLAPMFVNGSRKQLEQIGVGQIVEMEILEGAKGRKVARYGEFLW